MTAVALNNELRVFTGNSNPALAESICRSLELPLGQAEVNRFPDGESKVRILDDVRGRDVFIVQSTCPPVNDHLMELLILIDAVKRASAQRVTAVIPYFGYARQDRKHESRVPITAKLVANLISHAGADRVLCMDLHATQIQGFFDLPVDHLYAWPVLLEHVKELGLGDLTVLSPDPGRLKLAASFAKRLGGQLAVIDKRRVNESEVEKGYVVGDIRNRSVLVVDDMISTGGSIIQAVNVALEYGAQTVVAMVTHAVFCGRAFERLAGLRVRELVVCDTIPVRKRPENLSLVVLSVAPLLAEAIRRTHSNESISKLFV
jgi:ribose-phosphate pyrophosphokinase